MQQPTKFSSESINMVASRLRETFCLKIMESHSTGNLEKGMVKLLCMQLLEGM
jgi:hypothetical protein